MISFVDQLEHAAAATWSPDTTVLIEGWRVSSNTGFTRRLNSATAVGLAETSLEAKRSVTRWLAERDAPLVVRVTPLTDPIVAESCQRNWYLEPCDETIVLTKDVDGRGVESREVLMDPLDGSFIEEFFSINGRAPIDDTIWERMVSRISPAATGLWIKGTAVAFVAVEGSVAFTYSVAVTPERQRSGIASELMEAAESWASERGAHTMALQVLGTNAPARRFYERLGYTEVYRYHYLQAASR